MQIELDGHRNWYYETAPPVGMDWNAIKLDSGINSPQKLGSKARPNPLIAIRSSPHRFGSEQTPWEDVHRPDQGYCRYFGDNKPGQGLASDSLGNKRMLDAFVLQSGDLDDRIKAPPILVFEAVPDGERVKGQVIFHGFGVITKAEVIVQRSIKGTFPNYVYDIALLGLEDEGEEFSWDWINARRNPNISVEQSQQVAPSSWRKWVSEGSSSIGHLRRNVVTRNVVTEAMQRPSIGTRNDEILKSVYAFFSGRNHLFETLAEFVASQIFREQGLSYTPGWITQGSGDGGFDFVGTLDLDPAGSFRSSRQVILGQAKCEKLNKPTSGIHIARLAARLRRGWTGVYVTTSYFSIQVQREILADRYPILLVDGLRLAETVRRHLQGSGLGLEVFLTQLAQSYPTRIGFGDPELVLSR